MSQKSFTLIELLVVIGLLAAILAIVAVAINPYEQFSKTSDIKAKAVTEDLIKSAVSYFASTKKLPWEKNLYCRDELNSKDNLADMPNCVDELSGGGNIKDSYLKMPELKQIRLTRCGDSAVLCYNPKSKIENQDAETKYDKFGVSIPGCPSNKETSPDCYWCRPFMKSKGCSIIPTPTPIPSPTIIPTATPIPPTPTPVNPWGQAVVFSGKVAGYNPPAYTPIPQYMEVPCNSKMNLSTNNLTVEAWIKPDLPAANGIGYRIVDNTYRLSMDVKQNGSDIAYMYYFDVQSTPNGCGQTVVYSGTCNWNPWLLCNYKTVTPTQFSTWRHIAGVMQNGNLHIYENGVKLNSYIVNVIPCNAGRGLHIGAGLFGTMTPFYDYFQGAIDEVRVSTAARYTSNFTPQKFPFSSDPDTLMLYHFDSNTTDSSPNNFNGNLTGSVYYTSSTIPQN